MRTRVSHLNVRLHQGQWDRLRLNDEANYLLALAMFYIGHSLEAIETATATMPDDPERADYIATARQLGLKPGFDVITVLGKK